MSQTVTASARQRRSIVVEQRRARVSRPWPRSPERMRCAHGGGPRSAPFAGVGRARLREQRASSVSLASPTSGSGAVVDADALGGGVEVDDLAAEAQAVLGGRLGAELGADAQHDVGA